MKPALVSLSAALVALLLLAAPAPAADQAPEWAYRMTHDLMSPYCPGRTLAACPSGQADQLRLWILMQASAGRDRASIEEELYARFGDEIRGQPRAEGWGLSAYAIPVLGFLVGGAVVVVALRRIVRKSEDEEATPAAPPPAAGPRPGTDDDELERLVDRELAAR